LSSLVFSTVFFILFCLFGGRMQKPGMVKKGGVVGVGASENYKEGENKARLLERSNSIENMDDESSWQSSHPLRPLLPLGWKLLRTMFWTGPQWVIRMIRLLLFTLAISPALVHVIWFYMTSSNMRRNVRYGTNPRNYLDIYFPDLVLSGSKRPVVLFVTGGAWIIGYKAWGALIGKNLLDYGIISVNPDYRNFPQGDVNDMLKDVDQALKWIINHIPLYGGDPTQIYLVGQSAGAQLCCINLINKAVEEAGLGEKQEDKTNQSLGDYSWKISDFRAIIGLSGPYDLIQTKEHMHNRGLHRRVQELIFGKAKRLKEVSPLHCALDKLSKQKPNHQAVISNLKKVPMYFLHGTVDQTVPFASSVDFGKILADECGIPNIVKLYPNKSHTDPILEDLMEPLQQLSEITQATPTDKDGNVIKKNAYYNDVLQDLVNIILGKKLTNTLGTDENVTSDQPDSPDVLFNPNCNNDPFNPVQLQRVLMLPRWCLAAARLVNPF